MKRLRQIMATTHVDRHGDKLDEGAVEQMVRNFSRMVLPVGIEHDPRQSPVGRVLGQELERLPDGALALIGDIELFEQGDEPDYLGADRVMPAQWCPDGGFAIGYDRNFGHEADRLDINKLATLLNATPSEQVKKSLDPIGVFLLGIGCAAIIKVADGFLGALGEDAYQALKATLKRVFARKKLGEVEKLLLISYSVNTPNWECEIQLILTNPTAEDIDQALDSAGPQIARAMARMAPDPRVRRVVFEYNRGEVVLKFGVRRDCVPVRFTTGNDVVENT